MGLFSLPQALIQRVLASLEQADSTLREVQLLAKNANEAVTEFRQVIARVSGK